jgi:hypothetical protein
MATGNKKQVAEVMVIACSRFFCWFFRETRRAITRLNADKIPAKTGIIIPIIPSACSVCTSSSLVSVLSFVGSLLLS